jgi:hypothetical protein
VNETAILVLEFIFSPSRNEVFVSNEDAASGIFFQLCRKRVREKEEYRISVKLFRTD